MNADEKLERMKRRTSRPSTPGEVLEDLLESNGLTVTEAAKRLGVGRVTVSQLVNDKRSLSPEMAVRLGTLFGNGPGIWLRLQQAVDMWDTLHSEQTFDIRPLVREHELKAA